MRTSPTLLVQPGQQPGAMTLTRRGFLGASLLAMGSVLFAACSAPASSSPPATPSADAPASPTSTPAPAASPSPTGAATPSPASTPTPTTAASVATPTTGVASPAASPTASSSGATAGTIRYTVAEGSKASYRVREQLARLPAPSDAVGTTSKVTGSIVVGTDGKILPDQSKLVVDLTSLQSDSTMRDGFIQRSTLDTAQYPTATFVPTETKGLPSPLPTAGSVSFQLLGNLTIHGVTRPAAWAVTAQVADDAVTAQATTEFPFEDFGMTPPRSMAVLSVVDTVKLEVTLRLTRGA